MKATRKELIEFWVWVIANNCDPSDMPYVIDTYMEYKGMQQRAARKGEE